MNIHEKLKRTALTFPLMAQQPKILLYIGNDADSYAMLMHLSNDLNVQVIAPHQKELDYDTIKYLSPDFVIMETALSETKYFDLCILMRSDPEFPPIPILFFIPRSDTVTQTTAIRSGCDGFLSKPLDRDLLSAYIQNLSKRHDSQVKNYRLLKNLERYISHRAREKVGQRRPEKLTATILFTDMRGFTETTLHKKVEDVFKSINALQTSQITSVHRYGGYVDKFTGDGLLAVFDSSPDHVTEACGAAIAIRQSLQNGKEANLWKFPPPVGMGIHSGKLLRGDIGGPEHMDFSVIGNTVNIAARLCGQAKPFEIVVSGTITRKARSRFHFDGGKVVDLKGLGKTKVYLLQ